LNLVKLLPPEWPVDLSTPTVGTSRRVRSPRLRPRVRPVQRRAVHVLLRCLGRRARRAPPGPRRLVGPPGRLPSLPAVRRRTRRAAAERASRLAAGGL